MPRIRTDPQTGLQSIVYDNGATESLADSAYFGPNAWAPGNEGYGMVPDPGAFPIDSDLRSQQPYASAYPWNVFQPAKPPYGDTSGPVPPGVIGRSMGRVAQQPEANLSVGSAGDDYQPVWAGMSPTQNAPRITARGTVDPALETSKGAGEFDLTQGEYTPPPLPSPIDLTQQQPGAPPIANILQPSAMPASGPPANEQELAARMNGWQAFGQQLKTNPNWQMALMLMGAQILQPRYGGQTLLGHASAAGINALNFMSASDQLRQEKTTEQQKIGLEGRRVSTEENRAAATIENLKATTKTIEENLKYLPEEHKLKHLEGLTKVYDLLQRGKYQDAHAALMNAEAQLKGDPNYQAAMIDHLRAQSQHLRSAAANLRIPARVQEVDALAQVKMRDSNFHPEETDAAKRKVLAEHEAWHEILPGGMKDMAAEASAENLVSLSESNYNEALRAGKIKGKSKQKWMEDDIRMMGMEMGFSKQTIDKIAGSLNKRAQSPTAASDESAGYGRQAVVPPPKPPGVPDDAQYRKLNKSAGGLPANSWGWWKNGQFWPDYSKTIEPNPNDIGVVP